jgi:hypothetical protein
VTGKHEEARSGGAVTGKHEEARSGEAATGKARQTIRGRSFEPDMVEKDVFQLEPVPGGDDVVGPRHG